MTPEECIAILKTCDAAEEKRASDMPDEQSALNAMFQAYLRLKDLGWREAVYCPKDGSMFKVIEAGSTGIFDCNYQGEWPTGHWFIYEAKDAWASRPILFKLLPEAQAIEDAKREQMKAHFASIRESLVTGDDPRKGTVIKGYNPRADWIDPDNEEYDP